MRSTPRRGFTLIELLLVVAVIGLIATVAMVAQRTEQAKRRDVKRVSDTRALQQALGLYVSKYGAYPVYTGCITGTDAVTTAIRAEGYISTTANFADPANPTDSGLCFYYDGNGSQYTLRYTLEANSSSGQAGNHVIIP